MYYKLAKDSSKGKTIISQAVIIKVLGIDPSVVKYIKDRNLWIIDIIHYMYGKIDAKYSLLNGTGQAEGYKFQIGRKKLGNKTECDTYILLGFDSYMKNVESVHIIPNKGYVQKIGMITIYKNSDTSKYDKFKVDVEPYNDAYQDFMSFIGSKTIINIDDIKEWLGCDKHE